MRNLAAGLILLALTACSAMRYDLDAVPFPVHADSGPQSADAGEAFDLKSKYVMYLHGLLEDKQPQVAALLNEHCAGAKAITDFRVDAGTSIWDWLGTHLSLGLVRLKTVRIRGRVFR
ncbi:MAG: hypothetical protein AB8H80_18150 [Planctomycetota bacterium]